MTNYFQLRAIARGERDATTGLIRDAFQDAGARLTDVHFFSGIVTVFSWEAEPDRMVAFANALALAGLVFDDASRNAVEAAARSAHEVTGTLAVTFAHGDPNLKHDVPAVPG